MGVYLDGLGSVTPLNTVTVQDPRRRPAVAVLFQEGQIVGSGRPAGGDRPAPVPGPARPRRRASSQRDQALLENAQLDLERYQVLVAAGLDAAAAARHAGVAGASVEGTVKIDQGQIDAAKLQLAYCRITAPIAGRLGLRLVDPGNIVHATDTERPRRHHPAAADHRGVHDPRGQPAAGAGASSRRASASPVEAFDREQQSKLATGTLLTVDNQIDPTTGTVRLKALFPNNDDRALPEPVRQRAPAARRAARRDGGAVGGDPARQRRARSCTW